MEQLFTIPLEQTEAMDEKEALYITANSIIESIFTSEIVKAVGFLSLNGITTEVEVLDLGSKTHRIECLVKVTGLLPANFSFTLMKHSGDYIIGKTMYYTRKSIVVDEKFIPADKVYFDNAEKMFDAVMRATIHLSANELTQQEASDEINKLWEMSQ